jgi:hypothetical protein
VLSPLITIKKLYPPKAGVDWANKKGMTAKKGELRHLHFYIRIPIHSTGKYMWLGKYNFGVQAFLCAHFVQSLLRKVKIMLKTEIKGTTWAAGIKRRRRKSLILHLLLSYK